MPVSQVPPPWKGSLKRDRFEGAEAKKASMLTDRAPVVRRHFNYSSRRPLQGRKGHPGLQQGQHVAGQELRREREQSYRPRWLPSVGVRAHGFHSQGTFGGEQDPVPCVSSPSPPCLSAPGTPVTQLRTACRPGQAAGGDAAGGVAPAMGVARWGRGQQVANR